MIFEHFMNSFFYGLLCPVCVAAIICAAVLVYVLRKQLKKRKEPVEKEKSTTNL